MPSSSQLLWGLHLDFDAQTVTLPEPKRIKAKYLLREPELSRGNTQVRVKLLRELAGSAQYWAVSAPEISPYLPAFYRLLQQHPGEHVFVQPRGSTEEVQEAWEELWDTLDWVRLQMEKPWGSSFRVAFGKLLPIRERLALPGMAAHARFVGGDATLDRLGAVDWKSKRYHVAPCRKYLGALEEIVHAQDHSEIIALLELLTFVVLAASQKEAWEGQMILYVTDNTNVQSWLKSRRARNRYVRALLLLLQRAEAEHSFTVDGVYVRTYHNTLNDWLTRGDEVEIDWTMQRQGWTKLDLVNNWEALLRDALRPSLKLPGESGDTASLAVQLAQPSNVPQALRLESSKRPFRGKLHQVKFQPYLACFEIGWTRGGGKVSRLEEADWVVCTLSNDPSAKEASELYKRIQGVGTSVPSMIVDAPHTLSQKSTEILTRLGSLYHKHGHITCQTARLGSFFARKRMVWLFGDGWERKDRLLQWAVTEVNACWKLPLESFDRSEHLLTPPRFVFTREPSIVTTGDPWLPRPCGHIVDQKTGLKHLVHSVKGVACGPRNSGEPLRIPGGTLLEDGTGRVRPLAPNEVWEMQGGAASEWNVAGKDEREMLTSAAVRECGWQFAQCLLQAVTDPLVDKAGVLDPDEVEAHAQLEIWLRAWGRNPAHPENELYLTSWKEKPALPIPTHCTDVEKAGAPRRASKKNGVEPTEGLVQPATCRDPKDRSATLIKQGTAALDQIGTEAIMAKLADSTKRVYATGWKQWAIFNTGAQCPLFLDGEGRSARAEDEQRLIRFVVFLHQILGKSIGGIRQRLSAIRYAHIVAGFPDPLVGRPRLWAAVAGLQRWEGSPLRKLPVTPSMLRWLVRYLKGTGFSITDQMMVRGALLTGWFFMLRASELLPQSDGSDPINRALRPADITFYKDGKACHGIHANEVVVQIRSSKTDQYGRGQTRSHHRSGGDLCPVEALAAMQALQPHRWRSPQDEAPLFRYQDGRGLDREGITHFIRVAALAAGFPAELAGSHSLRKGGATAFFATTGDLERLKRYGGWSSDAVHAYLYEDHVAQQGIASGMLKSQVITMPKQACSTFMGVPSSHEGVIQAGQVANAYPVFCGTRPHGELGDAASSSQARAFSWAPDRRVSFGTMAGADAAPLDRLNATNAFLANNPGLDLYALLGVPPNAPQQQILTAYRKKARELHPDKWSRSTESLRAQKAEEFKNLSAAKEILVDPLMSFHYQRWLAHRSQRARQGAGPAWSEAPRAGYYAQYASTASTQPPHQSSARPRKPPPPPQPAQPSSARPRKAPPPPQPAKPRKAPPARPHANEATAAEFVGGAPPPPKDGPPQPRAPPPAPSASNRPPAATRRMTRHPQPYEGRGGWEDLRLPKSALGEESQADVDMARSWERPDVDMHDVLGQSWEQPSEAKWEAAQDPQDDEFVYVEVDDSASEMSWRTWDSDNLWDEPAWGDVPHERSAAGAEDPEALDKAAQLVALEFLALFNKVAKKQKTLGAPPTMELPEALRQQYLSTPNLGYGVPSAVSQYISSQGHLQKPPPASKGLPHMAMGVPPKGAPQIFAPPPKKPPPPVPPEKGSSEETASAKSKLAPVGAASDFSTTPFFEESEVDWGGDEDERTEAEKREDAEILRKTKESMEAFLKAPPALKQQLRTNAWKQCCERLRALRLGLEVRDVKPHEGKYEADLAAGFSVAEARYLHKQRERAARHQDHLSRMPGVSLEDLPKSWQSEQGPERTLKPGFLKEREEKKSRRRREKWLARKHEEWRSAGSRRWAQPTTPEKAAPSTPPDQQSWDDDSWGKWGQVQAPPTQGHSWRENSWQEHRSQWNYGWSDSHYQGWSSR